MDYRHRLGSQCFFSVILTLFFSTFYYETDHRKCEITLGGWHCGLRLFKLGRPLHTGFEPRSLSRFACSTGQRATIYNTVAVFEIRKNTRACSTFLIAKLNGNAFYERRNGPCLGRSFACQKCTYNKSKYNYIKFVTGMKYSSVAKLIYTLGIK